MSGGTSTVPAAAPVGPSTAKRGTGISPAFEPGGCRTSPDWPLQSHLELGALPTAPGCARLHARQVLWEWGLEPLAEKIELLVSEIVTNAVRASQELAVSRFLSQRLSETPTVRLWLSSNRTIVLIQVWDADHQMPERQDTGPEAESGRGLLLVEALSAQWGSYVPNGWIGKVVWASAGGAAP